MSVERQSQSVARYRKHPPTLAPLAKTATQATDGASPKGKGEPMLHFTSYHNATNTDNTPHIVVTHYECNTIGEAHEQASHLYPTAEQLRVYADTTNTDGTPNISGVCYGALTVVKRTTANCCKREGTTHQYNLYAEVRQVIIDFTTATTERAINTAKYSHDIQDMLGVARLALLQAISEGQPLDTQYRRAYKELNKYLYDSRAVQVDTRPNHYSIEQLTDRGVEVVQVWKDINILLMPDTRYTAPNYEDEDNGEDIRRKAIKMLVAILSPVQLQILKCLARGMTQRAIAEHMNRNIKTIAEHIAIIRKKAVETFTSQCPEVIPKGWTSTDTEDTQAKAKGHTAEYYRQYRLSKKN